MDASHERTLLLADYSELGQPMLADGSDVGVSRDRLHLPVPFVYDSKQSQDEVQLLYGCCLQKCVSSGESQPEAASLVRLLPTLGCCQISNITKSGIPPKQVPLCSCRGSSDGDMFSTVAIAYTLGSVTVPSLASVYNEFALKKHMDTSVHEQNFFLYFYGALFNLLGVLATMAFGGLSWSAIFHGHSKVSRSNQTISTI